MESTYITVPTCAGLTVGGFEENMLEIRNLHVEIEGKKIPVEPGDAVFIPGDAPHHILNPGPEPLTVLWVLAADRFSECEYRYELPDKAAPVPVRHKWRRDRTARTDD